MQPLGAALYIYIILLCLHFVNTFRLADWGRVCYAVKCNHADVAELVDALASGASEHCARGGSSPLIRTKNSTDLPGRFYFWFAIQDLNR